MTERATSPNGDTDDAPGADEAGISLDDLKGAFAQMLGTGDDPYPANESEAGDAPSLAADDADACCPISPQSILEAMLFVGHPQSEPLTAEHVAGLMRGVRAAEVDDMVNELNARYDQRAAPFRIAMRGAGYVLELRDQWHRIADKFHGRMREARLSPAAIEVLSLVAYNGSLTAEQVSELRGTSSGAILSQLVRRQLLRLEREDEKPRVSRYFPTQRFLDLFSLESLDELPRSQDLDER